MSFPEFCLRGIRVKNWVLDDQKVAPMAFEPIVKNPTIRDDGLLETSISWEDNEEVLDFCFTNFKNNFEFGAVRLSTIKLDFIISGADKGHLLYERRPVDDNNHHGNILFYEGIPTRSRRLIESSLSFFSSKVIPNNK